MAICGILGHIGNGIFSTGEYRGNDSAELAIQIALCTEMSGSAFRVDGVMAAESVTRTVVE